MKFLVLIGLVTAVAAVGAQPSQLSAHPRVGELCEISFARGSTRLPDSASTNLGQIAAWAIENPDGLIVLDGHSGQGEPIPLSQGRAEAVRDQLIAIGIDPDQLVIAAFGSAGPTPKPRVIVWVTHQAVEQVLPRLRDAMAVERGAPGVSLRSAPESLPQSL